jgi:hypothetical protein
MPAARNPGFEDADFPSVPGVTHRFVDIAASEGPVRIHLAEAGAGALWSASPGRAPSSCDAWTGLSR